ncbi:MAG: YdcH family protein [Gammaproteobacteria bacterium]
MLGETHDLVHEFPELEGKIAALRESDARFAQLMDEYDALDAEIRRLEELGAPVCDETLEEMKKKRVHLKDRLYASLNS